MNEAQILRKACQGDASGA